jgi:hypothetical protein
MSDQTWSDKKRCADIKRSAVEKLCRAGHMAHMRMPTPQVALLIQTETAWPIHNDLVKYMLRYVNARDGAAQKIMNLMLQPEWKPMASLAYRQMVERCRAAMSLDRQEAV